MLSLVDTAESERPRLVLFKACVLADHGNWDRAPALVHSLAARERAEPQMSQGLKEWFMRETRQWNSSSGGNSPDSAALETEIDGMLDLAGSVHACARYEVAGVRRPDSRNDRWPRHVRSKPAECGAS